MKSSGDLCLKRCRLGWHGCKWWIVEIVKGHRPWVGPFFLRLSGHGIPDAELVKSWNLFYHKAIWQWSYPKKHSNYSCLPYQGLKTLSTSKRKSQCLKTLKRFPFLWIYWILDLLKNQHLVTLFHLKKVCKKKKKKPKEKSCFEKL